MLKDQCQLIEARQLSAFQVLLEIGSSPLSKTNIRSRTKFIFASEFFTFVSMHFQWLPNWQISTLQNLEIPFILRSMKIFRKQMWKDVFMRTQPPHPPVGGSSRAHDACLHRQWGAHTCTDSDICVCAHVGICVLRAPPCSTAFSRREFGTSSLAFWKGLH